VRKEPSSRACEYIVIVGSKGKGIGERLGTLHRAATVVTQLSPREGQGGEREREREHAWRTECRGNAEGAVFVRNFRIWHTTEEPSPSFQTKTSQNCLLVPEEHLQKYLKIESKN
jgi:hypothetical protein